MSTEEKTYNDSIKICFTASSGGHFAQLMELRPLMEEYPCFLVTEQSGRQNETGKKMYYLHQVNRKEARALLYLAENAVKSWRILRAEKPQLVLSTGVLATIPLCLLAKAMGIRLIYIESFAKINSGTLTGRFLYHFADVFFVQWESMLKVYPKAKYLGGLY